MARLAKSVFVKVMPRPMARSGMDNGTNFTLYSANATKVEICLFDSVGGTEQERLALPEYTDQIWHGYVPDVHPGSSTPCVSTVRTSLPQGIASIRTSGA